MFENDNASISDWPESLHRMPWEAWSQKQMIRRRYFFLREKDMELKLAKNEKLPANEKRELLPLVIGITGHRDIAEASRPAVEKSLKKFFEDLQQSCPYTPLLLLSPLADGADRIAAETILELPNTRLMIPMPMALEEYRKTFAEDGAEIDTLLARGNSFVVPHPKAEDSPWDARQPQYTERPDCFEALGLYIAEHCHVLVAVWDNVALDKVGGTSQVVKIFLTGQPNFGLTAEDLVKPQQRRPVIQVWTGRQNAGVSAATGKSSAPGTVEILISSHDEKKETLEGLKRTLLRLDSFNRKVLGLDESRINRNRYKIPARYLTSQEIMLRLFSAQASPLAADYAKRIRRSLYLMITLCALSLTGFMAFRLGGCWYGAVGGGLAIIGALAIFACLKIFGWQNKQLRYRGFLEALRVLFFWKLEGIPTSVIKERYMAARVRDSGENRWMHESIAYFELTQEEEKTHSLLKSSGKESICPSEAEIGRKTMVLDKWIEEQLNYFDKEQKKAQKAHQILLFIFLGCAILGSWFVVASRVVEGMVYAPEGFLADALFILTPFIMIAMAISLFCQFVPHVDKRFHLAFFFCLLSLCLAGWLLPIMFPESKFGLPIMLLLGYLLLPFSALAGSFMKLSAFSENAKRYKEAHRLFFRVYELVKKETNESKRQKLITYLGEQALSENSAWLRQHIERPIGLPVSRRNF